MKTENGKGIVSLVSALALSFGYAVGWGAFVMPGTMFLPGAGPMGTVIGIALGAAAVSVFAFNYHRMLQRNPGPGGAYTFALETFGPDHGFLLSWFLWLTYVAILWANSTALVLLARFLFGGAFQFGFHYSMAGFQIYLGEVLLCIAATALCGALCIFRRRLAVAFNTILAGVFVAGVVAVFAAALARHEGGFAAMSPAFSPEGGHAMQIVHILSMIPWAFVGFEAIVHSSGEFKFPVRRTILVLLAAIALSAAVYLLLAILPVLSLPDGYASWSAYIENLPNLKGMDAVPVFAASKKALGAVGVAVIGGAMLAAQLTGIFGTLIASGGLMRAMSKGGVIPSWFGRLGRDGTPVNAILFVTCVSFAIPFLGRTVIGWPVDVSNLGAALAYGYTSAAVLAVSRKETGRAALAGKVSGTAGMLMSAGFCLLMLVPNYISGESLSAESYLVLSVWCLLGFFQYRHVFHVDWLARFGHSIVVWVCILVLIFFSSLMWIRLAIYDSSEVAFGALVGKTVTAEMVEGILKRVSVDMLGKMLVELLLFLSSLAIILSLFSILRRREKNLLQQKLEAEESAGKSRSYFFSTISHDIRTPLNAIVGYSEMMKSGFKTEAERQQAVDSILLSGKILLRLVNHALDFSRLETGNLEIIPVHTAVSMLATEVVDSFKASNTNKNLEIRCKAEGLPALLVDPQRIAQILSNLVGNAVKFTKTGFIEVRVTFEESGGGAGRLCMEVEDSGPGISPEDVKNIMSPYRQVSSKESRHGGTGLGLALCKQLSKAMHGELNVASEPGKGSLFKVVIPDVKISSDMTSETGAANDESAAPQVAAAPSAPGADAAPAQSAGKRRILIVDDQKMNLMVLKAMLKKIGDFDIETAMNGVDALAKLVAKDAPRFDLVLTDIWMPEMDGVGLVHAIRADPALKDLPVYAITADIEQQGGFSGKGFTGLYMKPVTVEKMKECCSQSLHI